MKNHLGYAMSDGRIIARDGAGDDVGATMSGGLLIVRGDAGKRVGGGMEVSSSSTVMLRPSREPVFKVER